MKHGKYKLGDFGLVSKANTGGEVQEGDSRYMSRELLELDDRRDLTKVRSLQLLRTRSSQTGDLLRAHGGPRIFLV